jgi:superfamily II DNA or RNA helicase
MKDSLQFFKRTFRIYQKRVLDNATSYLDDGKIHIVAAPGSGKTILGLELISRLQEPAIVFSPSITIRQQWLDRYRSHFMTDLSQQEEYLSSSLLNLKLITSVTYQGLHAAMNKLIDQETDELLDKPEVIDYSSFDLIKACIKHGIKTICLDEAHHLRNEWHKSLVSFIHALGSDIKIIALTATPPYDSNGSEWEKYITLCGDIDEEIFIPELVGEKTLAPHQDFIYFNYPTDVESNEIHEFRQKSLETLHFILDDPSFKDIINQIYQSYESNLEQILEKPQVHLSFWVLLTTSNLPVSKKLIKQVTLKKVLPTFDMIHAEIALNFVFEHTETYPELSKYYKILQQSNLIERGKITLRTTSKLIKTLVTSTAKLNSMITILRSEHDVLKDDLRMLVLTDYIKKECIKDINTSHELTTIGATTIFEAMRRQVPQNVTLSVLTGSLVILPASIEGELKRRSSLLDLNFDTSLLSSDYILVTFKGSNKHKVSLITSLFEDGFIQVIIGTASLLGEGWDSPSINSLILASYVGSFMLSNQMRGRAIRINPFHPDKVAHIWHLVSLEPKIHPKDLANHESLKLSIDTYHKQILSSDYETLKKRFECFMGPSYSKNIIESGIDRIDIIKPPFNEKQFQSINKEMMKRSKDRELTRRQWNDAIIEHENYNVFERTQVESFQLPKSLSFYHYARELLITVVLLILYQIQPRNVDINSFSDLIIFSAFPLFLYLFILGFLKLMKHTSPLKHVEVLAKALRDTLSDLNLLESKSSKVRVYHDEYHIHLNIELTHATRHDMSLFTSQMKEMLSPIINPRYLLVRKSILGLRYKQSFSAPSLISKQKDALLFSKHLKKRIDKYVSIYTRDVEGRKHLIKCMKYSFINRNDRKVQRSKAYLKK